MTHHPPPAFHPQRPTAHQPSMAFHPPEDDRSPEQLVAAGGLRRHPDPRPHPALGHSPIGYVATTLWAELTALAIAPAAAEATATALLRAIADRAVDAALAPGNERAPRDDLYVADPAHIGPYRRAIWFQRSNPHGPHAPHAPHGPHNPYGSQGPRGLLTPVDARGGYAPRGPITASFAPHEP
ncbi:hypothetical protein [Kitasatospora xanthocidica]|uniref:hypothetical protein n=1 Tax=Kitasatospora xanthocidica TaxID=83382 RepID=UPI0011C40CFA|nr:hypothetical protein [Kitasatospora xanthocidica]